MIVDLRKLEEGSGRLIATENVQFKDAFGEPATVGCEVSLSYDRAGGAYYFHGDVRGVFETRCHRCLEPVKQPIEGEFDIVVRRARDEVESEGEDEEVRDYISVALNEHEVAIDQYIYENVAVSVPMLILCDDTCKGLCSGCGANLNRENCKCEGEVDPRWQALKDLGDRDRE